MNNLGNFGFYLFLTLSH